MYSYVRQFSPPRLLKSTLSKLNFKMFHASLKLKLKKSMKKAHPLLDDGNRGEKNLYL